MDSHDEELTIENVDELVEELVQFQLARPATLTPLSRVACDLKSLYDEERRLKQIWERISRRAPFLDASTMPGAVRQPLAGNAMSKEKRTGQDKTSLNVGSFNSGTPGRRPRRPYHWRNLGIGLVAALALIVILAWPVLSLVRHSASQPPVTIATPRPLPTGGAVAMQKYANLYFTIQYPANWTFVGTTTGETTLQTAWFHPLTTSSVKVSVEAMPHGDFSNDQLLRRDPDVQRGTLVSTETITQHGISWVVGLVNLASPAKALLDKLEVAYTQQQIPYKIEFSAPPDLFEKYLASFTAMLSSFYPQTVSAVTPTATQLPTAPPSPTTSVQGMKEYSNQYFKIQYPANWVITSVTTDGNSLQTVQFRPSAQSAVFVKISAMYGSILPAYLLLQLDPDVELGGLLSTNTVTYHGIPWATDIVKVAGSAQTRPEQLEIAYSNQKTPYRIEFGAPPDQFASYMATFNAIFASFYSAN
ncbi:MAG TPA: hypothetical protein VFV38_36795 [Ktedonobacteraceae bacterium]|nr:hypothetical protein [Ktedonobacteraceae bacterium]